MRKIIIIFISLILFIPNVFATTNAKTLGELKSELKKLAFSCYLIIKILYLYYIIKFYKNQLRTIIFKSTKEKSI